jgi:hypothetical protein
MAVVIYRTVVIQSKSSATLARIVLIQAEVESRRCSLPTAPQLSGTVTAVISNRPDAAG